MRTGLVPILEGDHQHDLTSKRTVIKTDEFEFLKQSIALRAEALKLEFRSFLNDLEREDVLERLASEAESLGYRIGREGMSVPAILSNDSILGGPAEYGHDQGPENLERARFEAEYCSEKAWNALSFEEQEKHLEEFHSLCAQGIGEDYRFYRLLMDRYLPSMVQEEQARCGMGRSQLVSNSQVNMDRARPALERCDDFSRKSLLKSFVVSSLVSC